MKIREVIERRIEKERFYWITTSSFNEAGKWFNCLYINFVKEEFPTLAYPSLVEGWSKGTKRFDYRHCDVADIDWHGGITFYEEKFFPESGRTIVEAGCDFQHLYDDHWRENDNGLEILKRYAPKIEKQFLELVEKSKRTPAN